MRTSFRTFRILICVFRSRNLASQRIEKDWATTKYTKEWWHNRSWRQWRGWSVAWLHHYGKQRFAQSSRRVQQRRHNQSEADCRICFQSDEEKTSAAHEINFFLIFFLFFRFLQISCFLKIFMIFSYFSFFSAASGFFNYLLLFPLFSSRKNRRNFFIKNIFHHFFIFLQILSEKTKTFIY